MDIWSYVAKFYQISNDLNYICCNLCGLTLNGKAASADVIMEDHLLSAHQISKIKIPKHICQTESFTERSTGQFFTESNGEPLSLTCFICYKNIYNNDKNGSPFTHLTDVHNFKDTLYNKIVAVPDQMNQQVCSTTSVALNHKTSQPDSTEISRRLTEMIAAMFLPLSFIEHSSFKSLLKAACPNYIIPPRKMFSTILLLNLKNGFEEQIKNVLERAEGAVYITTGLWTNTRHRDFIGITANVAVIEDNELKMRSVVLGCKELETRHGADNIHLELEEQTKMWNIKPTAVIGHNNKHLVLAAMLSGFKHIKCIAHAINMVIQNTFKDSKTNIQDTLKRMRSIVGKISNDELVEYQKKKNIPENKLVQDIAPQKWNYTYDMIERAVEQRVPIDHFIEAKSLDSSISPEEWELLTCVVKFLAPFNVASSELCQSDTSISVVIPVIINLKAELESFAHESNLEKTPLALSFLKELSQSFCNRFDFNFKETPNLPTNKYFNNRDDYLHFAAATALDPRFKLTMFDKVEAEEIQAKIEKDIIDHWEKNFKKEKTTVTVDQEKEPPKKVKKYSAIFGRNIDRSSDANEKAMSHIKSAIVQYFTSSVLDPNTSPLQHWQKYKSHCPSLYTIATQHLSCPPTTMTSDSIFFCEGVNNSSTRKRIKPKYLDIMTFLNINISNEK